MHDADERLGGGGEGRPGHPVRVLAGCFVWVCLWVCVRFYLVAVCGSVCVCVRFYLVALCARACLCGSVCVGLCALSTIDLSRGCSPLPLPVVASPHNASPATHTTPPTKIKQKHITPLQKHHNTKKLTPQPHPTPAPPPPKKTPTGPSRKCAPRASSLTPTPGPWASRCVRACVHSLARSSSVGRLCD